MEIQFKRKKMKVDLYGEKIELKVPTVGEVKAYQDSFNAETDQVKRGELVKKFILSIGFPEEKLDQVEYDDYLELITFVMSPKKKSIPLP